MQFLLEYDTQTYRNYTLCTYECRQAYHLKSANTLIREDKVMQLSVLFINPVYNTVTSQHMSENVKNDIFGNSHFPKIIFKTL